MKTIFVGNLGPGVTQDELQLLFGRYGDVTGIDVMGGQDFGYVRMNDDSEAYRAIKALNGIGCGGRTLSVYAAIAYRSRKREISIEKQPEMAGEVLR